MSEPVAPHDLSASRRRLRADCSRCTGLCCVGPGFAASADFAIDKPAGRPCPHLQPDFACGVHASLRERGFPGCTVFDCFGAGQQVVQVTYPGSDWRRSPREASQMFEVFTVMRQLHEILWYVAEALTLAQSEPLERELAAVRDELAGVTAGAPDDLVAVDGTAWRVRVGRLLDQVSERHRNQLPDRAPDRPGADLIGADLQATPLRGASLRGAYLIGADLRDADLHRTDLLGADLRAADVRGARLADSLFLTQPQVEAARGDARTTIPEAVLRPRHWAAS